MDILNLMKERRSIRKFQDKQIDREDLEKLSRQGYMRQMQEADNGQRLLLCIIKN